MSTWVPRLLGTLVAAFLALFALDALTGTKDAAESVIAFVVHLTPACVVLVAVALAWHRPRVGAFLFTGLAVAYAAVARRPDWVAAISGPLLLVALAFEWSDWRAGHPVLRARS